MSKEKVLHNPIAPRKKDPGQTSRKGPVMPGEFKAPSYDNRTSCSVSAGDDYGSGFRTPLGSHMARSLKDGPIPQKSVAFEPDTVVEKYDQEG